MDSAFAHDGGKYFKPVNGMDSTLVGHSETYASGVDAPGLSIDRSAENQLHNCAKFAARFRLALSAAATCVITCRVQDSADGSSWADYTYRASGNVQSPASKTVTAVGSGNYDGEIEQDTDLVGARQYVRGVLNFTFSVPGTDTGETSALFIFTGGPSLPQGGPIPVTNP